MLQLIHNQQLEKKNIEKRVAQSLPEMVLWSSENVAFSICEKKTRKLKPHCNDDRLRTKPMVLQICIPNGTFELLHSEMESL